MGAGIRTRHGAKCASGSGKRCKCSPSYEAWVLLEARRQEDPQDLQVAGGAEVVAGRC